VLRQAVGVFNQRAVSVLDLRDIPLPTVVYGGWALATAVLVLLALVSNGWRNRLVLAAVAVAGLLLPITAAGYNFPPIGVPWRGRYGLPLLVGIPIVAGALIDNLNGKRRTSGQGQLGLMPALLWLAATLHVVAFASALRRFTVGAAGSHNPVNYLLDPVWSPKTGPPALYTALFVVSMCGLVAVLLFETRTESERESVGQAVGRQAPVG
jgi:hypothetical protein